MTSALTQETASRAAVAEKAPAASATATASTAVSVSAVPETPAELIRQWAGDDRPNPRRGLWAVVARCWDNLAGPGMTEQDRLQRDIAEARGFAYGYTRLP